MEVEYLLLGVVDDGRHIYYCQICSQQPKENEMLDHTVGHGALKWRVTVSAESSYLLATEQDTDTMKVGTMEETKHTGPRDICYFTFVMDVDGLPPKGLPDLWNCHCCGNNIAANQMNAHAKLHGFRTGRILMVDWVVK
jgi:hypothetical protein